MSESQSIRPVRDNPITTLSSFLEARREKLRAVMVKGMDPDRIVRIALAAASKDPKIAACTPASIYLSIYSAVQLGIEPNSAAQEGYIVPFGREATFLISFRGLARLAYEGGIVQSIVSNVVFDGDEFHVKLGLHEDLTHEPAQMHGREQGNMRAVYAVAKLKDSEPMFCVLWAHEVEKIRSSSRSGSSGPWTQWPEAMWRKTAVRRLCKLLPRTGASARLLGSAIAMDDASESDDMSGVPDIDISMPEEVIEQKQIEASTTQTERIAADLKQKSKVAASPMPVLLDYIKGHSGTKAAIEQSRKMYVSHTAELTVSECAIVDKALADAEANLGG